MKLISDAVTVDVAARTDCKNNEIRQQIIAYKTTHKYNITSQNMTHFITQTHTPIHTFQLLLCFLMIHDKLLIAFGEGSFMFLTYQLSMVGYWPSMAVTGPIESLFESGEGA